MFETFNSVEKCSKCGRKLVVSLFQFGVSHVSGMAILCPDCTQKIDWNEKYFVEHPEETERIKGLLKDNTSLDDFDEQNVP